MCSSCKLLRPQELLSRATQDDVYTWWNEWGESDYFQDEHYNHNGPVIGEYYCGC